MIIDEDLRKSFLVLITGLGNLSVGGVKRLPYKPQDQRSRIDRYLDIPPRWCWPVFSIQAVFVVFGFSLHDSIPLDDRVIEPMHPGHRSKWGTKDFRDFTQGLFFDAS